MCFHRMRTRTHSFLEPAMKFALFVTLFPRNNQNILRFRFICMRNINKCGRAVEEI